MRDMIGPSFSDVPLIEYEHLLQVFEADELARRAMRVIRFGEVKETFFVPVQPFHRELNLNES